MIDKIFWKFILVGTVNTIFGTVIMFVLYNFFNCNYWISSIINYVVSSVLSFFLNKHFTFKNREKGWMPVVRFTLNIMLCYLLAYGIAKPAVYHMLIEYSITVRDNFSLLVGMVLFVIFNYMGQRFFAFRNSKASNIDMEGK